MCVAKGCDLGCDLDMWTVGGCDVCWGVVMGGCRGGTWELAMGIALG